MREFLIALVFNRLRKTTQEYGRITLFLISLFIAPLGLCHPGYYGTAFHAHTVEQAMDIAAQEQKLIFIYANENDRGWKHFRWPSKQSNPLIDLLVRESVIVEIDLTEDADQLAAFNVSSPSILILDNSGKYLNELAVNSSAALVKKTLEALVRSDQGMNRIDRAIKSGRNEFFNRERLAAAHVLANDWQAAIKEYNWCLEQSILESSLSAKSRRAHVIYALSALSEEHKGAFDSLVNNRDIAKKQLLTMPNNTQLAGHLALMDELLGQHEERLKVFQQLPEGSSARIGMFDAVSNELSKEKKYEDILSLVDPLVAIDGEITLYDRNKITKPVAAEKSRQRGSRAFVIERSLLIIEALAGVNRDDDCQSAVQKLVQFDSTVETQKRVATALLNAGRADLERQFVEGLDS